MIELELVAVRVELPSNTPVLVLRELVGRRRQLTIFIGNPEATAIAFALEGVDTPRPLTHDLFCDVLDGLGTSLERVVITELRETTYYADLHLSSEDGPVTVSSRPSDAVALVNRIARGDRSGVEKRIPVRRPRYASAAWDFGSFRTRRSDFFFPSPLDSNRGTEPR